MLTEVPEFLAGLVLAFGARHGASPLAFCGETSQNILGSEAWVTPRFGLAPAPVSLGAGALSVRDYGLRWHNGYFHRWTVYSEADIDCDLHSIPPFSRRAVLRALRGSYLTPKSSSLFCHGRPSIPSPSRPRRTGWRWGIRRWSTSKVTQFQCRAPIRRDSRHSYQSLIQGVPRRRPCYFSPVSRLPILSLNFVEFTVDALQYGVNADQKSFRRSGSHAGLLKSIPNLSRNQGDRSLTQELANFICKAHRLGSGDRAACHQVQAIDDLFQSNQFTLNRLNFIIKLLFLAGNLREPEMQLLLSALRIFPDFFGIPIHRNEVNPDV
jgi:hypothetical protein